MINYLFMYVKSLMKDERGQGAVEYALIIALVSIIIVGTLAGIDGGFTAVVTDIIDKLTP